mgnify:FL=1
MSITIIVNDELMRIPSKNEVCPRCLGDGTHDAWSNGMTADEMDEWGEDFIDDYLDGKYDVLCEECHGNNVIEVIDESQATPEQIEAWEENQRIAYQDAVTERQERMMCYGY